MSITMQRFLFQKMPVNPAHVYLIRHRQGLMLVRQKFAEVTDAMIRKQLPTTKVPKSVTRMHDWSVFAVAELPDDYSAFALTYYLHELRRKRERLYESNTALRDTWLRNKFPKRHSYTYEAVSDLSNALEYLYSQPEGPSRIPNKKKSLQQPMDVRKPEGPAIIHWQHEWYKGKDEFWVKDVQHQKLLLESLKDKAEPALEETELDSVIAKEDIQPEVKPTL
ncbi:hypothetical protein V1511DRAFT_504060 [Dipodascopsis uninucleata]